MRALLMAAALVAAPAILPAAAAAQVNTAISAATAGVYAMDPGHTSVTWRLSHLGLSMYTGRFSTVSGELTLNPAEPAKSAVSVTIAAASVDTGHRDAQGARSFDEKIAKDALGAQANPNITFRSTSLTQTGPTTGRMTGDMTLNGITKPVTFDVVFNGGQPMRFAGGRYGVGFSAKTKFKRSDFAVEDWLPFIGDEVEVIVETEFVAKPAA